MNDGIVRDEETEGGYVRSPTPEFIPAEDLLPLKPKDKVIGVDFETSGYMESGPELQYDDPNTVSEPLEELYSEDTYKDSRNYKKSPVLASDIIRNRLFDRKIPFHANDTIYEHIKEGELERLQEEVEAACVNLLHVLLIDIDRDHNTGETAARMAKMYINEVMKGRYHAPPKTTLFPNAKKLDEIYTVGPITVRSMCSHHFVPIIGSCWVGVIPGKHVVGLSKFNRSIDWIMSRPQIQEEAIIQVADMLEKALEPIGVAVVMKAEHMCMCWRGVKDNTTMTNSVMRGVFGKNPSAKQEFLQLIKGQKYV